MCVGCDCSHASLAARAKTLVLTPSARPTWEYECWQLLPCKNARTFSAIWKIDFTERDDDVVAIRLAPTLPSTLHTLAPVGVPLRRSGVGEGCPLSRGVKVLWRAPCSSVGELLWQPAVALQNATRRVSSILIDGHHEIHVVEVVASEEYPTIRSLPTS